MNRSLLFLLGLLALGALARAAEFQFDPHTLTVPDGFVVERIAGPPLVHRPINMAFDETGALYVTDSSGSNAKPAEQVKNPTHRIVKLIDRDGDGIFDTNTVFADKLALPEGAMWLDGSLYVAAPPQIWKFTDGDGDGLAEKREVWFDGKTLTGCANDLHGPYAGPDGFIYWCKGAFAEQKHKLADGREFVTRASHVFRARPDGSELDVVMTGGMDNPVGVAFSASGEMFVSGTFFQHPGGGKRDGILHAVRGGVWGKDHAALQGHPRTGDLMPIMTHLGPAAPSGLAMARSDTLGLRGNLLCAQFNMRKVSRHVLSPDGSTFKTADSDFLVSDQVDFHPTDVIEDADGSILIADTGGWYRLCCPTSTIAKPDVLGAIYRVKKKDAAKIEDPRGLRIDLTNRNAVLAALTDPRPALVERAVAATARIEPWSESVLLLEGLIQKYKETEAVSLRLNIVWAMLRSLGPHFMWSTVRNDPNPQVRALAVRYFSGPFLIAKAKGGDPVFDEFLPSLSDPDVHVQRVAAASLGRLRDTRVIAPLLKAAEPKPDRFLQHALIYALYEIGDASALPTDAPGAAGEIVRTARAMIAKRESVKPMAPLPEAPVAPPVPLDPAVVATQRARLDTLAAHLKTADAKRGAEVYRSAKALCTTCHAMANSGGTFGPDLTKIGAIRSERDLLEAIVYPSASFVRSYEPMLVKTKKAEFLGILKKDAPDEVALATAPNVDTKLARQDIVSVAPATVSLMPPGLDGILTPQELADLVAYLRTAK